MRLQSSPIIKLSSLPLEASNTRPSFITPLRASGKWPSFYGETWCLVLLLFCLNFGVAYALPLLQEHALCGKLSSSALPEG